MDGLELTPQPHRHVDALPDLLTRDELAAFTGISKATFARWAMTGEGPRLTKLGRAARYRKGAVMEWLQASDAVTPAGWVRRGHGR